MRTLGRASGQSRRQSGLAFVVLDDAQRQARRTARRWREQAHPPQHIHHLAAELVLRLHRGDVALQQADRQQALRHAGDPTFLVCALPAACRAVFSAAGRARAP